MSLGSTRSLAGVAPLHGVFCWAFHTGERDSVTSSDSAPKKLVNDRNTEVGHGSSHQGKRGKKEVLDVQDGFLQLLGCPAKRCGETGSASTCRACQQTCSIDVEGGLPCLGDAVVVRNRELGLDEQCFCRTQAVTLFFLSWKPAFAEVMPVHSEI